LFKENKYVCLIVLYVNCLWGKHIGEV
jgi:hypothetical protein